jgi:hypothetical protein
LIGELYRVPLLVWITLGIVRLAIPLKIITNRPALLKSVTA